MSCPSNPAVPARSLFFAMPDRPKSAILAVPLLVDHSTDHATSSKLVL
jgi:hypothetical protein